MLEEDNDILLKDVSVKTAQRVQGCVQEPSGGSPGFFKHFGRHFGH